VRWELDLRGFQHVKLIASGGLDEKTVAELEPYVDGFGVGTSIANARTIDFGMDIVEIEGTPVSKRGNMSGSKQVWRNPTTIQDVVLPLGVEPDDPGRDAVLIPLIDGGKLVDQLPDVRSIRQRVLDQLAVVGAEVVPIG
jgi:nicotinate phosphoribosyltransferase